MKKQKKGSKLASLVKMLVLITAGILLVILPGGSLDVAVSILGFALLAYGVFAAVSYFTRKPEDRSILNLVVGILAVVFGTFMRARPEMTINILPIVAGVLVFAGGIMGILRALRMKKNNEGGDWKIFLILAVVEAALGILIFANPFATMNILVRVFGVILIYMGVTGAVSVAKE